MILRRSKRLSFVTVAALAAGCVVGCGIDGSAPGKDVPSNPGLPGVTEPGDPTPPDEIPPDPQGFCNAPPVCNDTITVDPKGPALLVTDPAVLAELPLQKVLGQILAFQGVDPADVSAEQMLQRLFDTMNTEATGQFDDVPHCDSFDNPATQNKNGDTFTCPRPEGALASSAGLMKKGDPDFFYPVAVVNRFDLTPIDGTRCGQYRIIFAKNSGLSDPDDRVFLIFEAALANPAPGCLEACRPVAQFWKGLEGMSSAELATNLRTFFFSGIPGFKPAIHPLHYGLGLQDQGYGGTETGQIRVSMHMSGGEWDMRELHVGQDPATGAPRFDPATVKNNPPAYFFNPESQQDFGFGEMYRQAFIFNDLLALTGVGSDGKQSVSRVQMFTSLEFNGVESLLAGEKKNDYVTAATASGNTTFIDALQQQIDQYQQSAACPAGDPMDAEAVIRRANALSCAGCHAPADFLGPERSIGCGLTWPDSLGQSHVNEKSELSPALKDVFLPHRAEVMQNFLQACDLNAMNGGLQGPPPGGGGGGEKASPPSGKSERGLRPASRTLGGSQSH